MLADIIALARAWDTVMVGERQIANALIEARCVIRR
jgi:hypothetical protein